MKLMIALALAASQPAISQAADPVVAKPPRPAMGASFMTDDDYPADARKAGLEGTTKFSLRISNKGKVLGCRIVQSSGVPSLDAATCEIMSKMRFTAAQDANGNRIEAEYARSLDWRLPGR
ncbi:MULTISPECIES: energy transducer TonB [unclassified Sphingobium]|uniref:energy transducer TonB n=1 Tax=unclassified Sphingobium TaxID=2611147 RepID=UPI00222439EF|nr:MULTISPECIES: energy transducer TonB [unclassified Sphingobium]MCW2413227.1 TonB family protein [Sphingobium sp. B8D3D]MCW2414475.1 TonB family protein [Sphingobium sp. B8D3A]